MDPFGSHGLMFGWIFWLIIVIAIALLIIAVINKNQPRNDNKKFSESPFDILERRYASGEISKAEFERMKKDLI